MKFTLPVFCVFLTLSSFAAVKDSTCTIYGTAPGREGNVIQVLEYDDYITYTEEKLAETVVGDSGKFSLSFDIGEVTNVFLRCKNVHGFLFAEPGRNIEVMLPERDSLLQLNPNVDYKVPVNVTIDLDDSTDMNFLASDYNWRFNTWWDTMFVYFVTKQSMKPMNDFHAHMDSLYARVKNPYFKPWMDYSMASIEDATFNNQVTLAKKYLDGKPVYYHNSEYMEFFNSFFKDYLYRWSMRKEGEGISFAINMRGSYDSLMGVMKHLPWMENDSIRELVMLKGLFELYNNPAFDPGNILSIAQQASVRSKISESRRIARNILRYYTKLKNGTAAPHFLVITRKDELVDPLDQYKGKFIYLFFYDTKNPASMAEYRYMSELQKRYRKVVFVSVSVDDDTAAWKKFLKTNPKYNWPNYHYDFRQKTRDDYNLYSTPSGFLIDPDGNLYASPADNPSGDLEFMLYKICYPKKPALQRPGDR
ncbi:MAG TPA: thioredoxin-like domain-containing protein [Bacteroidia bacterium]|nr:thioredoxin-like domain-containing protein [Bacteroidia bacterium]